MVASHSFSDLKDRQKNLLTHNEILKTKTEFTKQDIEILKLIVSQSIDIISDLIDTASHQQTHIRTQDETNEKLQADYTKETSDRQKLMAEMSISFASISKIFEIASRDSKETRTQEE